MKDKVIKRNQMNQEKIQKLHEKIDQIYEEIHILENEIIAPCKWCPYDGVYRCEACQESNYSGFNIKSFPNG